ncbi:hypothetical protein KZP23_02660 [Echinicola marina]|uniref:hypothetical protein n=1 Tax=Echinicola marina TaxID=2859768 RepID=UPI001CF6E903|nr:hypothetical protein [Echinicola marina]UCS93955.1 hypothetical protein KZP23_02660 [Echinicola marina]
MTDFFNKLENFLFDVLGLILPGLILIIIVATPLLMFDFKHITSEQIDHSTLLSTFKFFSSQLSKLTLLDSTYTISLIILFSYILGHLIKVFSIIFYDFGRLIFDNSIVKLFDLIAGYIFEETKYGKKLSSIKYLKDFVSPINNTIRKILTFQSSSYFPENEPLVEECVKIINKRLNTSYPNKWYSIYKFSVVINSQEKLKSLSGFFLAKYNLYRSLSFLFVVTFLYFMLFYNATELVLAEEVKNIKTLIVITSFLLWFTFHVKFKRYWTLCGNETLVSLFYFLNRGLLSKIETDNSDAG